MSILVKEDEYENLLKIQREYRKQHQQPKPARFVTQGQKLAKVEQAAKNRSNEERREILAPPAKSMLEMPLPPPPEEEPTVPAPPRRRPRPSTYSNQAEEAEVQAEEGLNDLSFPFLPATQWVKARRLLHELLRTPGVDLHQGCLYVQGKPVGHVVLVLHHLFGNPKTPTMQHVPTLYRLLEHTGLITLVPRRIPPKTKKTPVKIKKKSVREKKWDIPAEVNAQVYRMLK